MTFARVNPTGWTDGVTSLTSIQLNQLDIDHMRALDGAAGGVYNPSSPLVIGGAGLTTAELTAATSDIAALEGRLTSQYNNDMEQFWQAYQGLPPDFPDYCDPVGNPSIATPDNYMATGLGFAAGATWRRRWVIGPPGRTSGSFQVVAGFGQDTLALPATPARLYIEVWPFRRSGGTAYTVQTILPPYATLGQYNADHVLTYSFSMGGLGIPSGTRVIVSASLLGESGANASQVEVTLLRLIRIPDIIDFR